MKKYDFVIWDFNGTIFDDVDIGVESINALLKKRGLKVFSDREAYKNSFCFPIKKWYEELGFDFLAESYDNVAVQWIKEYLSREHKAGIYEGVREALSSYSNNGARQVIISASETGMLKRQLCELGIYGLFDEVLGKDDIFATGKEEIALKWRSQNKGRALFIGDTDHDLAVAQAIGADCVLVSSGHQSFDRLTRLKNITPQVKIIQTIKELL